MSRGLLAIIVLIASLSGAAAKSLVAQIDLSDQVLTVIYKGEVLASWPVSTGRAGYRTPPGTFRPQRMYRDYYSRQYEGAPMPNAIFFERGYAIHGSWEIASLGQPASHGCVRLHPSEAETLFEMVVLVGPENTAITVQP
ncbi:MAG: L,D-transpeptidase [Pseudomonadota bacterium]